MMGGSVVQIAAQVLYPNQTKEPCPNISGCHVQSTGDISLSERYRWKYSHYEIHGRKQYNRSIAKLLAENQTESADEIKSKTQLSLQALETLLKEIGTNSSTSVNHLDCITTDKVTC